MKMINRFPASALMAFVVLAFPLFTHTALGQSNELGPLMDRIERMQRDIRTLNTRLARGERPAVKPAPTAAARTGGVGEAMPRPAAARISQRLADMEDEVRASTGRMEDLSFRIDKLSRRLEIGRAHV